MEAQPGCSKDPDSPELINEDQKIKTREILQQYLKDSQDTSAENTINYVYTDADILSRELSELYSYSEECEFTLNVRAFEDLLISFNLPPSWRLLSMDQKKNTILRLLEQLETNNAETRMNAARCILYIAQGCWADLHSAVEQTEYVKSHVILLYRLGTFSAFVDLLKIEVEKFHSCKQVSQADSEKLRVILSVLYTITEVIRSEREYGSSFFMKEVDSFCYDLLNPTNDELLVITLFDVLVTFSDCATDSSHFPLKKFVLLLWKLILMMLGGIETVEETKKEARKKNGLPPQHDPVESDSSNLYLDFLKLQLEDILGCASKRIKVKKRPKVRQEEYDDFLDEARMKYLGYSLIKDRTTTAGLPDSVCASIDTIRKHLYVPLGQLQIDKERKVRSHPFTNRDEVEMTSTEILYQKMLPNFKNYIIALVKMLIFVLPNHENRTFTCQPTISGIPRDNGKSNLVYTIVLNIDMFRHEEIILKAVSAILLLLLKHFKINHVYQFEYMCQCLVFNNILPILMTFFNQNISAYVKTLNEIPALEFPSCVIEYQPEITVDSLNLTNSNSFSSRNMFLCINLLRILNKITKWKPARIAQLVLVDSKTILRRLIRVNNEIFKLYALKLLKMQMKYLEKSWRKSNIEVLTEIYLNVRLHLNDNFLTHLSVENLDKTTKNKEELVLSRDVSIFNRRRYSNLKKINDVTTDNCTKIISGISWNICECLKRSHDQWLQQDILS